MYSTVFWCLFVVLLVFWLYCVNTVFTNNGHAGKKLLPSHESEALQDKQKLQMKTAQV